MSIEKASDSHIDNRVNQLGYRLFREGSVRRFNPSLFAVRREDGVGWFLVELKEGRWMCDCNTANVNDNVATCPHVYAVLLSSATNRICSEDSHETMEERSFRCRHCASPDIRKAGFRYNSRGISRIYFCNECHRKFSVSYVEPQAALGAPSGVLWLLSQVAMLTSKLNDLLRELDERIASTGDHDLSQSSEADRCE